MFKRLLTYSLCVLLGCWNGVVTASSEQGKSELEKPIKDQQFAQSPAAATVTINSIQPRQTKEPAVRLREPVRDADSWIRWPSLTDF